MQKNERRYQLEDRIDSLALRSYHAMVEARRQGLNGVSLDLEVVWATLLAMSSAMALKRDPPATLLPREAAGLQTGGVVA